MKKPSILALTISAAAIFVSSAHGQQTPAANPQQPPAASGSQTSAPAAQAKPSTTGGSQSTSTTPKKPAAAKPGPAAAAKTQAPLTLKTQKDKVSYAIGMSEGNRLKQGIKQGDVDVDQAILLRAIKDELSGGKVLLTDKEAQDTLAALQADIRKNQELKAQQLSENNKKESEAFLAANKSKDGVVTMPSGLQYKVLEEGTGPKPTANDTVTVNYRGTLLNGTEFDNSYKRGQPAAFALGQIIKGWGEALQLMPVGSKWELFIPSDLAYGPAGRPPVIGPNSTLVFEVELLSVQPRPAPPGMPGAPSAPGAPPSAPATSTPPVQKLGPPTPKPDAAPAPTPKPPAP